IVDTGLQSGIDGVDGLGTAQAPPRDIALLEVQARLGNARERTFEQQRGEALWRRAEPPRFNGCIAIASGCATTETTGRGACHTSLLLLPARFSNMDSWVERYELMPLICAIMESSCTNCRR